MSVVTQGYGFPSSTIVTRGYGLFDLQDLFGGSVAGSPIATPVLASMLEDLAVLDDELDALAALDHALVATDLVGTPVAQALTVGVAQVAATVSYSLTAQSLEEAISAVLVTRSEMSATALTGELSASDAVSSAPDDGTDMMGTTDEQTGVK